MQLPSAQVRLKWEQELQRIQRHTSREKNLPSLFSYSDRRKGTSFPKEQMPHETWPLNPSEGPVTCDSICGISRGKLFPEQMPMFYVYCIC